MKNKHLFIFTTTLIGSVMLINIVFAHPGRTDRYGCHACRTNCPKWGLWRGEYHCHNSKGLKQPKTPIKSKKLY